MDFTPILWGDPPISCWHVEVLWQTFVIQIRQNHVERKNIYKKTEALRKVADGLYGENALGPTTTAAAGC